MFAAESKVVAAHLAGVAGDGTANAWKLIAGPIEPFLEAVSARLASQVREFDPALLPYAEYALTGQGKQLRPALVALSANAINSATDTHITLGVIIEMVHLATLVHDDVMDDAEIRRGRLTLSANWGIETAVLFGDCLFAQALKLAAGYPTPEVCRAVSAATNTVCAGEILQTRQRRNVEFSKTEYFKVIRMKTAELFALSCDLGGHLAGASPAQRNALFEFGIELGTAYQVYDDCLDVFGSEAAAGKSLGTDLAKGKLTLPLLCLLERAEAGEKARLRGYIEAWEPRHLAAVLKMLARHEALQESVEIINKYLDRARAALSLLPETSKRVSLEALTHYLARQTASLEVCE